MYASSSSVAAVATTTVEAAVLITVAVDIFKNHNDNLFEGMVSSSFNIQYQSTGVGLLSLLDEIELRQSV